jgi:hypothetical protein
MKKLETFTVVKHINENQYSFEFIEERRPFIESIFFLLRQEGEGEGVSASIITNGGKMRSIEFCAHSVEPLQDFIQQVNENGNENGNGNGNIFNHVDCIHLVESLHNQSTFLKKYSLGFYGLDINEIYVINSSIFICIQPTFIKEVSERCFSFLSPIYRELDGCFFSPEIMNLATIPATVFYTCFYYSLGALAVFCLFGKKVIGVNSESNSCMSIMKSITGTKLYWMLLKMLELDCKRRVLLFF